jgi:hypothetical protein
MNELIRKLSYKAEYHADRVTTVAAACLEPPGVYFNARYTEKLAQLIVYDFLSELTNDDSLGDARIKTIARLAEKWGVANTQENSQLDWQDFDDAKTCDAIRALGIEQPTLVQVTNLQKAMATAYQTSGD